MTPTSRADISQVVDAFEAELRAGKEPSVGAFIGPRSAAGLLAELLHVDLDYKYKQGVAASVADYLSAYPQLRSEQAAVVELLKAEFEFRKRRDPALSLEQFAAAYPEYATDLQRSTRHSLSATGEHLPHRVDAAAPPELPGYEVLGTLGRGGMGVVYKARQTSINRTVALKMVLSGQHASPEELSRFHAEAAAVAGLAHPHVVQLFEFGTHQGLPYFTLEYMAGGALGQQIKDKPIAFREAALLVQQLAGGIAAAHARGIVHRDLKPDNVLLSADGTPKVADFGLAKQTQVNATGEGVTATGVIVGTPSYMSPEQARGEKEIGPATDVWALGAILYRLFTARPPFLGASPIDTLKQVAETEPVAPRALIPGLPRDLETICLKCLRKEPGKRYGTAQELADDLQKFLRGEPILARPAGLVERSVKWARRRPAAAAVVGLAALLVVGLLVGLWIVNDLRLLTRSEKEQKEGALARVEEEQAKLQIALRDQIAANKQRRATLNRISERVVESTFGRKVKLTESDRRFFQGFMKDYEELAATKGDTAEALDLRGEGLLRIAILRHKLGELAAAEALYQQAAGIYEQVTSLEPANADYARLQALVHHHLGSVCNDRKQLDRAEAEHRQALAIRQRLSAADPDNAVHLMHVADSHLHLGNTLSEREKTRALDEYREAFRQYTLAIAREPNDGDLRRRQAGSLLSVANMQRAAGQRAPAVKNLRQAQDIYTKLLTVYPDIAEYKHDLAAVRSTIGFIFHELGNLADAEKELRAALAIVRQLVAEYPAMPKFREDLAKAHGELARLLDHAGRDAEAEAEYTLEVDLARRLAADFAGDPDYRKALAVGHANLGNFYKHTGRLKPALDAFVAARALLEAIIAEAPHVPEYRFLLVANASNHGLLLRQQGAIKDAETLLRDALERCVALVKEHSGIADYRKAEVTLRINLALVLGDWHQSIAQGEQLRAAAVQADKLVEEFPDVPDYVHLQAECCTALGNWHKHQGDRNAAEKEHLKGLAVRRAQVKKNPDVPEYRHSLFQSEHDFGLMLSAFGKRVEAEKQLALAEESIAAMVKEYPEIVSYGRDLLALQTNRGALLYEAGQFAASERILRQAIERGRPRLTLPNVEALDKHKVAQALIALGRTLDSSGKATLPIYQEALALSTAAAASAPENADFRRGIADAQQYVAMKLLSGGKTKEGIDEHRKAIALLEQLAKEFPASLAPKKNLALAHSNFGELLGRSGQPTEARQSLRAAIAAFDELVVAAPDVPEYRHLLASARLNTGVGEFRAGNPGAGVKELRVAWQLVEKLVADDPAADDYQATLGRVANGLAANLYQLKQYPEALQFFRQALKAQEMLVARFPTALEYKLALSQTNDNLGILLTQQREFDQAEKHSRESLRLLTEIAKVQPDNLQLQIQIGGNYCNLANALRERGQADKSVALYLTGQEVLAKVVAKEQRLPVARQFLRNCHMGHAMALTDLGKHADAAKAWERVMEYDPPLEKMMSRLERICCLMRFDTTTGLADLDNVVANAPNPSGRLCYDLARACALGAAAKSVDEKESEELSKKSLEWLRKAKAKGVFSTAGLAHFKTDRDFESLRARDDFKSFLEEIAKK